MNSQIFKKDIPDELLFEFLEKICLKTDKYYLIDYNAFKKMIFNKIHSEFVESLKEYYYLGKYFYLEREMTYKSFTNIVRQICKHNNIMYTSSMKYNKSKYNIDYLVYF